MATVKAYGSYLHHGSNNQYHLPGYQPERREDLDVEAEERMDWHLQVLNMGYGQPSAEGNWQCWGNL